MSNKKGFVLLQTMISVVLETIVILSIFELLLYASTTFSTQNNNFKTAQEISVFLLKFTKDVQRADTLNSITSDQISFTVDGGTVTYAYNNGTITRNAVPVVTGATSVQFTETPAATGNLISVKVVKNGQEMETTVYAK